VWLTNERTPWSRVLPEKLTGSQLVKKCSEFYGTRRLITSFTSYRHLTLFWALIVRSLPPYPTSWLFIFILSSLLRLGLPGGLFLSGLPTKAQYATLLGPPTPRLLHTPSIVFFLVWSNFSCAVRNYLKLSGFGSCRVAGWKVRNVSKEHFVFVLERQFHLNLRMTAARSFETSGTFHPATRRHIPEDRKTLVSLVHRSCWVAHVCPLRGERSPVGSYNVVHVPVHNPFRIISRWQCDMHGNLR
jgi:hypothetical protein